MNASLPQSPELEDRARALRGPLLELLDAPFTRPTRDLRRVGGPAAYIAAVLVGIAIVLPGTQTTSALAVTRTPEWLQLTVTDATASPDQLTADLHRAGIDGEVRVIPVPADLVGRWATVLYHVDRPLPPGETTLGRPDRVQFAPTTIRIPVDEVRSAAGDFVFFLGRAAAPGEATVYDGRTFPRGPYPERTEGSLYPERHHHRRWSWRADREPRSMELAGPRQG